MNSQLLKFTKVFVKSTTKKSTLREKAYVKDIEVELIESTLINWSLFIVITLREIKIKNWNLDENLKLQLINTLQ